jgi:hypothetical protein
MLREQKLRQYTHTRVAKEIHRPQTSNAIVRDEKRIYTEKMPVIKRELM